MRIKTNSQKTLSGNRMPPSLTRQGAVFDRVRVREGWVGTKRQKKGETGDIDG